MARIYYLVGFVFIGLILSMAMLKDMHRQKMVPIPVGPESVRPGSVEIIKMNAPVAEKTESEQEIMKNLIELFASQRAMATETGDISATLSYISAESKLKRALTLQNEYFLSTRIVQRLLKVEVIEVKMIHGIKNAYAVKFKERIDLKHPDSDFIINNYEWICKVAITEGRPLIYELEGVGNHFSTQETFVQKVSEEQLKENKYDMVQQAMEGLKQYFEVDYLNSKTQPLEAGCGHTYGSGLFKLISTYDERKERIQDKKMQRKILMSQIKEISRGDENGILDVSLRIQSTEDGITTVLDRDVRVNLKYMGFKSWHIIDMENLPMP